MVIDRPRGSVHPVYRDCTYPVHYGYIPGVLGGDGEEQDAYLLGVTDSVSRYRGVVTAVILRDDDCETKWVVQPADATPLHAEEIYGAVGFMEQHFSSHVVCKNSVTVIGSANVDLHGAPNGTYLPQDSNPGIIRLSVGGVGCNIARNLSGLGWNTRFITALGQDALSHQVREELCAWHLDTTRAVHVAGGRTSTYLYVTDERGNMVSAVSDMEITQALTPEAIEKALQGIPEDEPVVFDANCSPETILWIGQHVRAPLAADAVSVAKALRLTPVLSKLTLLKCNAAEACALSGQDTPEASAQWLRQKGVQNVFITMGRQGICGADAKGICHVAGVEAPCVRNTTGAGDSFLAGVLTAYCAGKDLAACARFGAATAALTCTGEEAVYPGMSKDAVYALLG